MIFINPCQQSECGYKELYWPPWEQEQTARMVRCQSLHRNENTGKGMFNLLTAAAYESYEIRDSPEYALDRLWGIQTWSRGCLSKTFPSLGSERSSAVMKASRNTAPLHALFIPQNDQVWSISTALFFSSHSCVKCEFDARHVHTIALMVVSWPHGLFWASACPGRSGTELAENRWDYFPRSLAPFPLFLPASSLPFTWNFLGFTIRGFLFIWSNYFASWLGSSTRCNLDLSQLQICCMFFFFHHLLNIAAKFIKPRFMSFPSFSYKIRRQPSVALQHLSFKAGIYSDWNLFHSLPYSLGHVFDNAPRAFAFNPPWRPAYTFPSLIWHVYSFLPFNRFIHLCCFRVDFPNITER